MYRYLYYTHIYMKYVCVLCVSRYTSHTYMLIYKSVLARNKSQPPIQIRARAQIHTTK